MLVLPMHSNVLLNSKVLHPCLEPWSIYGSSGSAGAGAAAGGGGSSGSSGTSGNSSQKINKFKSAAAGDPPPGGGYRHLYHGTAGK